jgi:CRP-like cAMP-binding protein
MHKIASSELSQNRLIATLRPQHQLLFSSVASVMTLRTGHILYEPGDNVTAAWFPLDSAVASFHVIMEDGAAIETAMIGNEGAIGGIVSQGNLAAYARSCVMHGGRFARVGVRDLDEIKQAAPPIRHLLARYADCLLAQIFQSVGCNAAHPLEQRAARWLTCAVDRTGLDEIAMTQDQFGSILGVGRSYASRLIQRLKAQGLLETRRAGLIVRDPQQLRARACGCEELIRAHFEQVLAGVYPPPAEEAEEEA